MNLKRHALDPPMADKWLAVSVSTASTASKHSKQAQQASTASKNSKQAQQASIQSKHSKQAQHSKHSNQESHPANKQSTARKGPAAGGEVLQIRRTPFRGSRAC